MNGNDQEKEKIRIMENTNDSLGKSLTTLSWLTTVNVDELRRKQEKEDKGMNRANCFVMLVSSVEVVLESA